MALTLRSVAGLTVPEIARALLSSEEAMERRLTRARRKITEAAIPFRVPPDERLPERLADVLRVVYLVYTEGQGSVRGEMCTEAIRLARLLARLMPDEPEVLGLLALLVVTDGRRPGRVGEDGALVSLEEQDRALWDAEAIAEGSAILDRALRLRRPGPYVIQAAIASLHMDAPRDWSQIAALYEALVRLTGSAVVELNRAIAVAETDGGEAGLALVDRLDLDDYQYFHSTRGDLLRRLGRRDEARSEYERALELAHTEPERRFLRRRIAELGA